MADIESRQRLRSASTTAPVVPSTVHLTLGDRDFSVAAARVWNGERPFTAGDALAIVGSLSAAFKDRTLYSVIQLRPAYIYFTFSVSNRFVILLSLFIFIL